jgi:hypothetical protein
MRHDATVRQWYGGGPDGGIPLFRDIAADHRDVGVEALQHLREAWSRTLEGIVDDAETIDLVSATLRRIENELIARRRCLGDQR